MNLNSISDGSGELTAGVMNEAQDAGNNMIWKETVSTSPPVPQGLSRKDSGNKQVCPHAQTTRLVPICDLIFSFG